MFISRKLPKSLLAIILLAFIFALITPCSSTLAAPGDKVFDIIEITDFHGTMEDTKGNPVAAVMAKNIKDIINDNPSRTLIVSGGDNYQGSILSNMLKGTPVMNAFNNIGVAVSALGNHEFDWGLATVTGPGITNYPIICSNLLYKDTNKRVLEPYEIFEKDGVKIAVVGAVTKELPNIVLADHIKDYDVGCIVDNVRQAAQDARAKGAQIVIALLHDGDNYDSKTGPVFDVANQLGGAGGVVDAVLGGHTHDLVNTTAANGTPVAIAGSYGKGFIDMKITRHTDGTLVFNTSYIANDTAGTVFPYGYKALSAVTDQAVNDIVNTAKIQVGSVANQKLGETDTDLTIAQADFPWGESLAGNWVCDVVKVKANADFAFYNNGGLRINIPQGDITTGTLYAFTPFDNTITTADLTGAQIKTLLEQAVGEGGKGIQAAGLTFTYNPGAPSGSRIVSISKTDGTPVNMTDTGKTYNVATNDFMAAGGDGFAIYKTVTSTNTNTPLRETLAENIRQAGHITAQLQGRIKNVQNANPNEPVTRAEFAGMLARTMDLTEDEDAIEFSDVLSGQWFAGTIGAAVKAGLVSGYEDGTFRPDNPISREEMTAMTIRAIKAAGFNIEVSDVNAAIAKFNDGNEISGWAKTPMAAAVEAGIIIGKESGDFAPFDHAIRAEATAILVRTQNHIKSNI
jgi:2',3'-cyclic-nucleotide 2'-phosphodiesterase/3'-nucleotidase